MNFPEDTYDLVVVGSGGGLCAALAAHALGKRVLVIEKTDKIGGSTGMSGGVWWIPNNPFMQRLGRQDSIERARQYMDAAIGREMPGSTAARRNAYLRVGPRMCEFLEQQGMKLEAARWWPDYYEHLPGGEATSRSVLATMFNLKELGDWQDKLRTYAGFDMPLHSNDLPVISNLMTSWAGKAAALKFAGRTVRDILLRRKTRGQGAAMQGRMLQILLRKDIPFWLESPVSDVIVEGERVTGVLVCREGRERRIRANGGVLISSGGFSRNAALRRKYLPSPTTADWTSANPGDTGELLETIRERGAATYNLDNVIWVPTTRLPDGRAAPGQLQKDGSDLPYLHVGDIGKPHLIMVDKRGERFVNESTSYMEIGQRMLEHGAVPAWIIADHTNRRRYPWGGTNFGIPKAWLSSGYVTKADTLVDLARKCGIDAEGLQRTVRRFNVFCKKGIDEDFGRGGNAYDRWSGDPTVMPSPSLGPIATPPFYAIAAFPGDVGTSGGLVCDEHSRVLRDDGSVIEGLYAAGNCTASVMGRVYPGAGASIGASYVFSFIAARHACGAPLNTEELV